MNGIPSIDPVVCAALVATLLILNAAFVAAEFSLIMIRFTRFGTGRMIAARQDESISRLLEDLGSANKMLRFGGAVCSLGIGFLTAHLIAAGAAAAGWTTLAQTRWAMLLGFVAALCLHYVLGELVPRAVAFNRPVRSLKGTIRVYSVFRFFAAPLSAALNGVARLILKALSIDPNNDLSSLDVETQIRVLLDDHTELPPLAESIVSNALNFRKRVAHDIMIPRNQLQYIDLHDSSQENLLIARKTGHTRFPLCEGDLDHCVGIVHVKDVFRSGRPSDQLDWRQFRRPVIRCSMDEPLEGVLQLFLKQKKHFALLTDEFGGTVGAVTLEDVLEELVGEIQDEFDRDEEMITELTDGIFQVDGLTPLHDLAEKLDISLEAEEVSTFGGYITYELGRMPRKNEIFAIRNLEITVTAVDKRRVLTTTVRKQSDEDATREPAKEEAKEVARDAKPE